MYGANEDEIVLSYNTTDGCNMVFAGTPWREGDRIVTTNLEHPAMLGPIRWARDYRGVEVVVVAVSSHFAENDKMTVADAVALFEPALTQPLGEGNKQYLAISEITYKNGLRLPVKELVELARANGGYSIIDSAHAWGMLPVDCHDYGADSSPAPATSGSAADRAPASSTSATRARTCPPSRWATSTVTTRSTKATGTGARRIGCRRGASTTARRST